MAVLDQLKPTSETPKRDISPKGRFRRRLVEAIELQMEIAKADLAGVPLTRTRQRRVRVGPNGESALREVPLKLRRWWWRNDSGTTFLALRHGAVQLELAPGKKAIEIGGIEELPAKLALLRDAARDGELDRCLKPEASGRGIPKRPTLALPASKAVGAKGWLPPSSGT